MISLFKPQPLPLSPGVKSVERMGLIKLTAGGPYLLHCLMSTKVTNVKKGDILQVEGEFQVTTELDYVVMVCSGVCLSHDPSIVGNGNDVVWVCPKNGTNIGRATHHYVRNRSGWWAADADYDEVYFNFIVYSASTMAKPGVTIQVNQGYGSMSVVNFGQGSP